jgi:monofunctional biosynthetic peptidoglycan transglycosylase
MAGAGIGAEGSGEMMVVDFSSGSEPWASIDDVVMGGVSTSEMVLADGYASFQGTVSFENNGGFASVRSRPDRHDLSTCDGLVLKVRGDGRRYGFRLRTSASFDGVSYQAELAPPAGEWQEVRLPFEAFGPVFRGRRVADHPPLDPAEIRTLGILIARQKGPFRLDIAWLGCYRDRD